MISKMTIKISSTRWCKAESILCATVLALITIGITVSPNASAEFYVRTDDLGRRHISNLPPRSFANNGGIRRAYDPSSIVYQHARMLEALAEQSDALEHAVEHEALGSKYPKFALPGPPIRRAPREGMMNLDELIELEKRGGHWQGAAEEQR
jgi:hypothetical protein